jgi:hypothetical protein
VKTCLGHPSKLDSTDSLNIVCNNLISQGTFAFNGENIKITDILCETKQYLCRYGECNNDSNCPRSPIPRQVPQRPQIFPRIPPISSPQLFQEPSCQTQISDIVRDLECNLPENIKNCSEGTNGWGNVFIGDPQYQNLRTYAFLGLGGIYQDEIGEIGEIGQHISEIGCIVGCWGAPYATSIEPASCIVTP